MAKTYDHKKIEKKWRKHWEEGGAYVTDESSSKPKQYVLDMFPYPSGLGLHTGHVEGYTATDIYARFKRMQGFNVLHPMGWDAFGLPAENYAIKTKTPPRETTNKAIDNFRNQIQSLGLSYDWSREVGTHNPDYYKWTQWFFLFLFENGLAEKRMGKVNWCPTDQTVLANEQTVSESGEKGVCVRCGTKIIQRELAQWFFKITDFADALVNDLDGVDWPESTKVNQRNWIGRSEGAEIDFSVAESRQKITVFTTRPDTIFGATYLVLAPEHPLISESINTTINRSEIEAYLEKNKDLKEIERTAEGREKTGVELKGIKAINPATKEEIPIWVADYVLGGYGTGAIMAVPAHDSRDFAFARKFDLPMKAVIIPEGNVDFELQHLLFEGTQESVTEYIIKTGAYGGTGILVGSKQFNAQKSETVKEKISILVAGRTKVTYRLRDWLISRQRYWGAPIPVVYDPEGKPHAIPKEHLPWLLPEDVEYLPKGTSPLGTSKELLERTEKIFGKGWKPEIDTMDTFVCSSWYFFRFSDPHNLEEFASKEAMQKWLPVDLYMGGAEHTVLHLMYARFITKALQKFGYVSFGEPFKALRHQGMILAEDGTKMSKSKGNVINPDEFVELYGADTVRIYEMFMGPLEAMKPWNTQNIIGSRRFLERVWRIQEKMSKEALLDANADSVLQQTIKKVGEDIQTLSLNTAVSQMMICLNSFEKEEHIPVSTYESFLRILAPFAPHITEELWQDLGHTGSIHTEGWPTFDPSKLEKNEIVIAVQLAGKVKGTVVIANKATEDEVVQLVRADAKLSLIVPEKPSRTIFVPGRIINFIP
ncbi:MAG: leucine--tRNA ligase [Patescibacteria group bacterium]